MGGDHHGLMYYTNVVLNENALKAPVQFTFRTIFGRMAGLVELQGGKGDDSREGDRKLRMDDRHDSDIDK